MATHRLPEARSNGFPPHRHPDRTMATSEPTAGADPGAAQLHALIASHADGLLVVTPDDGIAFVNPAAEALLGRPAAQLVGQPFGLPAALGQPLEVDMVRPDGV